MNLRSQIAGAAVEPDSSHRTLAMSEAIAGRVRRALFGRLAGRETRWAIMLELYLASEQAQPVSTGDLLEISGGTSGKVARLLDAMDNDGLIVRAKSKRDKRITWNTLSPSAFARMEVYFSAIQALSLVPSSETEALLEVVTDNFG